MTNILDEILKQRFYSLLFEGGHRWLDARRHGRLEMLPRDKPEHKIHARFPIPQDEVNARDARRSECRRAEPGPAGFSSARDSP